MQSVSIKPNHIVVIAVVAGGLVGLVAGLLFGSARITGVVGAFLGLALGCLLTAISPRAEETPVGPGYHR